MTPLPKIGAPAQRALNTINIKQLEDLSAYRENDISTLHGVGPKAIRILKEKMKQLNFSFKE